MVRDISLARKARKAGASNALRIIWESRKAGIPISLGFALVEQESGFRNIFGHDLAGPFPGEKVTRARVAELLDHVRRGGVSNGVGLTQLTWPPLIQEADRQGGAHTPKAQLRVAFGHVSVLVRTYGLRDGLRRYNGSGPRALQYASSVLSRQRRWHGLLS